MPSLRLLRELRREALAVARDGLARQPADPDRDVYTETVATLGYDPLRAD
jgi:hypothetical protein